MAEPVDIVRALRARMEGVCARAGRPAGSVTLVGAAKRVPAERLLPFVNGGLSDVGENYVKEGVAKISALAAAGRAPRWHLIGALQTNKAREAVRWFDLIHSVDRAGLAQAIAKAAAARDKVQDVLLQVNVGDEASKAGCAPHEVPELAAFCNRLPNLAVRGLMCLPPYQEEAEQARTYFRLLRELSNSLGIGSGAVCHLSMGMSHDFEVAIEEGATLVRVGTALFGARGSAARIALY